MNESSFIPINRTAANVIKPGFHFEYEHKCKNKLFSENKIATRQCPKRAKDLTGMKKGWITVIGLYYEKKPDKNIKVYLKEDGKIKVDIKKGKRKEKEKSSIWVVRCSCGNYETRKAKSLHRITDFIDRCSACKEMRDIKRHDYYRSHGKYPDDQN